MASKCSGLLRLDHVTPATSCSDHSAIQVIRPCDNINGWVHASAVWHGSLKEEDALSIERIQAGVARCLLKKIEWRMPKPTLLEQLDWPALRWRREIPRLTFFHQIIQRQRPPLTDCLFPFAHSKKKQTRKRWCRNGK